MAYTGLSLFDPDTGQTLVIRPADGVFAATLDIQPAVRAVSNPVVDGDGTRDLTRYADAGAVTLSLLLTPTSGGAGPEAFLDALGFYLGPAKRPTLIAVNDQWSAPRQLGLRFDSKTAPVDNPITTAVAISWKAPAGCWVATSTTEYDLPALVPPSNGLHFTSAGAHFKNDGVHFLASTVQGDTLVTVPGSMRPPWRARLYGPCTGPKIANDTTGDAIIFTDQLVLAAGQYVELSSAARSANLVSDSRQSVLTQLDFAATTWWDLQPGIVNEIRYYPTAGSASGAVLTFTPAWQL